jgi:hypothetical protein
MSVAAGSVVAGIKWYIAVKKWRFTTNKSSNLKNRIINTMR